MNELQSNRVTIPKHQQKGETHTMLLYPKFIRVNIASDEEKFLRDLKIYAKTGFKHHFNNSNIQHKYKVFRLKYITFRLKYAAFRLKYTTFRLKYLILRLIYTVLILKYVVFKANLYFCYLN